MHVFKYSTFVLLLAIEPLHSEDGKMLKVLMSTWYLQFCKYEKLAAGL